MSRRWPLAEIGDIPASDCFAQLAAQLGVEPDLMQVFATEAFATEPDEALADYVASVRQRNVVVAALTNNMACGAELLARPELSRLFDLAISSVDARVAKPNLAFFHHAEMRLRATGAEIIFLDDALGNIEVARTLGWCAIHYKSTAQAIKDIEAALTGAV